MKRALARLSDYGLVVAFIVMAAFFAWRSPEFASSGNLANIPNQQFETILIGLAMTTVMITGGIDLSVGSVVALGGVVAALAARRGDHDPGVVLPVLAGVGVGVLAGALNGGAIVGLRVAPFVVTLASMTALRGLGFILTEGRPVSPLAASFVALGEARPAGVPLAVILLVPPVLLLWVLLARSRLGRHAYAVGGNEEAARLCGIHVARVKLAVYVISGAISGFAGALLAARLAVGDPKSGTGHELNAVAAAVLGGTSLSGGRGSVFGTLLGALFIAVLNNGLSLLGVHDFYQQVLRGVVILLAVVLDRTRRG